MRAWVLGAGLAAALLAAPLEALAMADADDAPAASNLLQMDAKTQARLGVAVVALQAATHTNGRSAFARGMDPGPLAQLDSDLATARAAAAASAAEAARTKALSADQTVSKQAAEAAQAQARQDALKLKLLRQRVGLEWGPGVGRLSDAARGRLIADIAAGRAALVRIDSGQGLPLGAGSVSLDLGEGVTASAKILGPLRAADPRLQSTGLLALVRGPLALRMASGAVAPATVPVGAGMSGVLIPRAALLRSGGQTLVYLRRDATHFERRPVVGGALASDGLFVASGFRPGEAVVTTGAAQLFAAQNGAGKDVD